MVKHLSVPCQSLKTKGSFVLFLFTLWMLVMPSIPVVEPAENRQELFLPRLKTIPPKGHTHHLREHDFLNKVDTELLRTRGSPFIDIDGTNALRIESRSEKDQFITRSTTSISISSDADFMVQGWPGSGTVADPYRIENLTLSSIEISLTTAHFRIQNCTFSESPSEYSYAIDIDRVENGQIINNTIFGYYTGIWIYQGSFDKNGILIENNTILTNYAGIFLKYSSNNTIINNEMIGAGIELDYRYSVGRQTEVTGNFLNGKVVVYWQDRLGGTVPSDAGQVVLVGCSNVTVNNLSLSDSKTGIMLHDCDNSSLNDNVFFNLSQCILLSYCSSINISRSFCHQSRWRAFQILDSYEITVINNIIKNAVHGYAGIFVEDSWKTTIRNNTCSEIDGTAIYFYDCHHFPRLGENVVEDNHCHKNRLGIRFERSDQPTRFINNDCSNNSRDGMWLSWVENCFLFNNTCSHNEENGLLLGGHGVRLLHNNLISNGAFGLEFAGDAFICGNVFIDNEAGSARVYRGLVAYPEYTAILMYNYWSDYLGYDSNNDGIGDVPHTVLCYNVQTYPESFTADVLDPYPLTSLLTLGQRDGLIQTHIRGKMYIALYFTCGFIVAFVLVAVLAIKWRKSVSDS